MSKTRAKKKRKQTKFEKQMIAFENQQRKLGNIREDITWDDLENGLKKVLGVNQERGDS